MARSAQVCGGFLRASQIRVGDDLHQRHAGAVVVHLARRRRLERPLVDELADVLLEVQALDADVPRAIPRRDREEAVLGERLLVLADLVVLAVRVVVVLRASGSERSLAAQASDVDDNSMAPVDDGREPGMPWQTGQGWVLGAAPKTVTQPQNILVAVARARGTEPDDGRDGACSWRSFRVWSEVWSELAEARGGCDIGRALVGGSRAQHRRIARRGDEAAPEGRRPGEAAARIGQGEMTGT